MKRVYEGRIKDGGIMMGRSPVKWIKRMDDCWRVNGLGIEYAESAEQRENWRCSCCGQPFEVSSSEGTGH